MDGGPHLAVFTLAKIPLALLTVLKESKRLSRQGAEGIWWEAFFCALCNSECAFNILGELYFGLSTKLKNLGL